LTETPLRGDPSHALRVHSTRRLIAGVFCAAMAMATAMAMTMAAPALAEPRGPQIADVEDSLANDPSYKVRVDAAIVLGRLGQPRSLPVLAAALRDPHPSVRASAAYALGRFSSPLARDAVTEALRDPAPVVRHMAQEALRHLGGVAESAPREAGQAAIHRRNPGTPRPSFEVKEMGDPEHRAGPALRSHMRDFLTDQLRPFGDVAPGDNRGSYAVDGVIKTLTLARARRRGELRGPAHRQPPTPGGRVHDDQR
jgi:hypothetical protein